MLLCQNLVVIKLRIGGQSDGTCPHRLTPGLTVVENAQPAVCDANPWVLEDAVVVRPPVNEQCRHIREHIAKWRRMLIGDSKVANKAAHGGECSL